MEAYNFEKQQPALHSWQTDGSSNQARVSNASGNGNLQLKSYKSIADKWDLNLNNLTNYARGFLVSYEKYVSKGLGFDQFKQTETHNWSHIYDEALVIFTKQQNQKKKKNYIASLALLAGSVAFGGAACFISPMLILSAEWSVLFSFSIMFCIMFLALSIVLPFIRPYSDETLDYVLESHKELAKPYVSRESLREYMEASTVQEAMKAHIRTLPIIQDYLSYCDELDLSKKS